MQIRGINQKFEFFKIYRSRSKKIINFLQIKS